MIISKKNIDFSIIIPTYRSVEKIKRTLNSIVKQKTSATIEVIIVDDMSPLEEYEQLKGYCEMHNIIKLYQAPYHSGGPSLPRNIGLKYAQGTYITFLDAGDFYVTDDVIEYMANVSKEEKSIYSLRYEVHTKYVKMQQFNKNLFTYENCYDIRTNGQPLQTHPSIWVKFFPRSLVEQYHLRFDEKLHLGEDAVFLLQTLIHAKGMVYLNKLSVVYLREEGSLSSLRGYQNTIMKIRQHTTYIETLVRAEQEYEIDATGVYGRIAYEHQNFLRDIFKECISYLKDERIFVFCEILIYLKALQKLKVERLSYSYLTYCVKHLITISDVLTFYSEITVPIQLKQKKYNGCKGVYVNSKKQLTTSFQFPEKEGSFFIAFEKKWPTLLRIPLYRFEDFQILTTLPKQTIRKRHATCKVYTYELVFGELQIERVYSGLNIFKIFKT